MGVIIKESSRATIISYIGVMIGFLSSALIMPKLFSTEEIGVIRVINATTGIFAGIFSFGVSQLVFRTYNRYGIEKGINGFLSLVFFVCALGALASLPVFLIYHDQLLVFEEGISEFTSSDYFFMFVYLVIVFRIFQTGLEAMLRMTRNVTLIAIMQNFFLKGIPLVLLALIYFKIISFDNYLILYLLVFVVTPLYAFVFIRSKEGIRPGRIKGYKRKEVKSMISLATFGMLNTMAAAFFLFLDTLMVNEYMTESHVGVYTTMFLFGSVVSIPSKSLRQISGVLIVESMEKEDYDKVQEINIKSAQALLVFCGGILVMILSNLSTITGYLDPIYASGILVVLIVGIAQLFDAFMGTSSEILSASKYYWVHTPITILMIAVAVLANMWLIPIYGMNGAAIATLMGYFILHATRTIFVYTFFKIHPFSPKLILGMVICTATIALMMYIPNLENIYLNLIVKSLIAAIIYVPVVYVLKISHDVNDLLDKLVLNRFRK